MDRAPAAITRHAYWDNATIQTLNQVYGQQINQSTSRLMPPMLALEVNGTHVMYCRPAMMQDVLTDADRDRWYRLIEQAPAKAEALDRLCEMLADGNFLLAAREAQRIKLLMP